MEYLIAELCIFEVFKGLIEFPKDFSGEDVRANSGMMKNEFEEVSK